VVAEGGRTDRSPGARHDLNERIRSGQPGDPAIIQSRTNPISSAMCVLSDNGRTLPSAVSVIALTTVVATNAPVKGRRPNARCGRHAA